MDDNTSIVISLALIPLSIVLILFGVIYVYSYGHPFNATKQFCMSAADEAEQSMVIADCLKVLNTK